MTLILYALEALKLVHTNKCEINFLKAKPQSSLLWIKKYNKHF